MSKKKNRCCCEEVCCCPTYSTGHGGNGCCGSMFTGLNSCVSPIIFLLIACGSGLLRNNRSFLIILLFLLCGNCFGNLFGTNNAGGDGCCCECDCCC